MNYQIIIPARADSKRLPGKNMKYLDGKPLIQYSIDFALKYMPNHTIWVNSNDEKIIEFSKRKKINVFKRPDYLATDFTPTVNVLKHQVKYFQANNISCDAIVLLQPTNPLRLNSLFPKAIKVFEESGRNSLATFSMSEKKVGKIVDDRFIPTNYELGQRSQDLENSYYENGSLYITKIDSILNGKVITEDAYPLICDDIESTVDIDYIHDFLFAETLLNFKNETK